MDNTSNVVFLRLGEGMPGKIPQAQKGFSVTELDFTMPLFQRYGDHVPAAPRVFDQYQFVADAMRMRGHLKGFTFNDLLKILETEFATTYYADYLRWSARFHEARPVWMNFDPNSYVKNAGADQVPGKGLIVALAALAFGLAMKLITELNLRKAKYVICTFGATGSTGIGWAAALEGMLNRSHYTSFAWLALLFHAPSIVIQRKVSSITVDNVAAVLEKAFPGCIVAAGMPYMDGKGENQFYADFACFAGDIISNATNGPKLAGEPEYAECNYTSSVLLLNLVYRKDLILHLLGYWISQSVDMDPVVVSETISKYIKAGIVDYTRPVDGKANLILKTPYSLLTLAQLQELVPACSYIHRNGTHVKGVKPIWWIFKEDYDFDVKHAELIYELLKAMKVNSIHELDAAAEGNGHASVAQWVSMAEYEFELLDGGENMTVNEIEAYFHDPENPDAFTTDAFGIAMGKIGSDYHYNPGRFSPSRDRLYVWTQPKRTSYDVTLAALSVMGSVEDPRPERMRLAEEKRLLEQASSAAAEVLK